MGDGRHGAIECALCGKAHVAEGRRVEGEVRCREAKREVRLPKADGKKEGSIHAGREAKLEDRIRSYDPVLKLAIILCRLVAQQGAVRLRVLPRPIPGCVKLSGMADQDGITWPAFYSWQMRRQAGGEFDGCWMLYQMQQAPPPIDVESDGGTPRVAAG